MKPPIALIASLLALLCASTSLFAQPNLHTDIDKGVAAIELMCAAQAIEYRRPLRAGAGVERAHAQVRARVAPLDGDRSITADLEAIRALISAGAFTPPENVDLISHVARWSGPVERNGRATVLVRPARAAGLRADFGNDPQVLLLEHRGGDPGGEDVARQQQHGQAVDGGRGRPGDHVGRPRADRGGAGEGGQAVAVLGVAGGDVDHALLVAGHVVGEPVGILAQGLADAGDVAVAEDAEAAGDQALGIPVALAVLVGQELDQGLGHGQPPRGHTLPPASVMGSRGSIAWPAQVPRTQAWAGSSQKRQARSSAGPAITFR